MARPTRMTRDRNRGWGALRRDAHMPRIMQNVCAGAWPYPSRSR